LDAPPSGDILDLSDQAGPDDDRVETNDRVKTEEGQ